MTSVLTTAALATNPIAYWPMEDLAGATTAVDVGPNNLPLSLQGTGASTHILPGQVAQVPGSAGSWSSDGTTAVYLGRAVAGGSPLQISPAVTFGVWVMLTAAPVPLIIGRNNNSFVTINPYTANVAYSSTAAYQPGALVQSGGQPWRCLRAVTNVTPGTDPTAWQQLFVLVGRTKTTTGTQAINSDVLPLNTPLFITETYSGNEAKLRVNTIEQGVVFASDTIAATTDPVGIFGTGSAAFTGFAWGAGIWATALDRGTIRTIYEAGVGAGNVAASAPFLDTVEDKVTPSITTSSVTYKCATCTGNIRASEGYVTVSGLKHHHGCYHARRAYVAPSILSAASTLTDFADRTARLGYDFLQLASRRTTTDKPCYHDGVSFQPINGTLASSSSSGSNASNTFWRSQTSGGAFAAVLARYSRVNRESWLVDLGRRTAEFIISTQVGMPTGVLAPGYSFNTWAGAVAGSNPTGMYAIGFDVTLNAHTWVLRDLCWIYLSLRHTLPAATLARWQQSIVAAANFMKSGTYNQAANAPSYLNDQYYVNGNYMIRYAQVYAMVAQITGDSTWQARHDYMLNYSMQPYGVPLTWLGNWAATTSYSTTGDGVNGPHAVRNAGNAYQCILSIAGSSGNAAPGSDPTHWQLLETGNPRNRQGMGMQVVHQGADAAGFSDYWGYVTEWDGSGGGGPPGSALNGQPGYSGDYNSLQLDYCVAGYLLTSDPRWKRLCNLLMNQAGLYPQGGGVGNPQPSPFSLSSCFALTPSPNSGTVWATDRTNGQSGGYSTRHSLVDGFRAAWLPISIISGQRTDLNAAFPFAQYGSQIESGFKNGWIWSGFTENTFAGMADWLIPYFLAAPGWPGF